MKNPLLIFVLIIIFGQMIGDDRTRHILDIVWMIACGIFILFLIVHSLMDKKGMFLPKNMYKKRDKES